MADDEDEDEDVDPDDVEADLDAILKNRLAAEDDDDDEEDEDAPAAVPAKKMDEFVCEMCFLVVNRDSSTAKNLPPCSMGDGVEPCRPLS